MHAKSNPQKREVLNQNQDWWKIHPASPFSTRNSLSNRSESEKKLLPICAKTSSRWWLNQPIWKICSSQIGSWNPQKNRVKIPKIFELPPPRLQYSPKYNLRNSMIFNQSLTLTTYKLHKKHQLPKYNNWAPHIQQLAVLLVLFGDCALELVLGWDEILGWEIWNVFWKGILGENLPINTHEI